MSFLKVSSPDPHRLAHDGVANLISWAQVYSDYERQEIETANRPTITALETERRFLDDKRRQLIGRLGDLPAATTGVGSFVFKLFIAVLLTVASFGLAEATLQPFNWGLPGHVFCTGLATLVPFATHQLLRHFPGRTLQGAFVVVTFISGLATLVPLAELRAIQLARSLDTSSAVVFGGTEEVPLSTRNDYKQDGVLLGWAMILGSVALELASGLAWHAFSKARKTTNFGLVRQLQKELLRTEQQLLSVMVRLKQASLEPAQRYAAFWRAFQQGLHDGTSRAGYSGKFIGLILASLLTAHALQAADNLHLIVAIDLSQTEAASGFSGRSEFEENKRAISHILGMVPTSSSVDVLGITGQTLTNPYTVLSARMASDPGYLSSRLEVGRRNLVSEWDRRAHDLKPSAPHTDLIGLFQFAAEIFARSDARRKLLLVFSDMRNDTGLDLEHPLAIDLRKSMAYVEKHGLIPAFAGVDIFVAGAGEHGGKRDIAYSLGLKQFWIEYIQKSGGTLRMFSTTRDSAAITDALAGTRESKK